MKKIKLFLLALLLIAALLRFYKLKQLFFFMVDESTVNLVAKRIVIDRRPILLGPDIPGGLHTGPLFYYLTALIMFFAKFNPLGEAIFASLAGVLTAGLLFLIAKKIFSSQRTALFSTIFYTFSCLVIIYNRTYNTLTFSLIAALLTYYSCYQLKKGKEKWIYLLSFALILGTHSEGSAFSLVLLSFLFFIFCLPVDKLKNRLLFLKTSVIFLLSFSPLIFFELRHNFVLRQRLLAFLSFQKATELSFSGFLKGLVASLLLVPQVFSRIFFLSGEPNILCQILPCLACVKNRGEISSVLLFLSLIITLFFLKDFFQKKKNFGIKLVGWHFFIMILGLLVYNLFLPGYLHEWLFAIFFPAFCMIAGYFFDFLWQRFRWTVLLFLGFFIFSNFKTFLSLYNPFSLPLKEKAIKYAMGKVGNKDFYLDSIGECYAYGGYRYLFWFYSREPIYSYIDELYWDWLYPRPLKEKPKTGIVLVHHSPQNSKDFNKRYQQYLEQQIDKKTFGNLEVLIID